MKKLLSRPTLFPRIPLPFVLFPLVFTLLGLWMAGCQRHRYDCDDTAYSGSYTKRAYLEQKANRDEAPATRLDEPAEAALVLDLTECDYDASWERQPYETVDEWLERIQHCMCLNRDTIRSLEDEYERLQGEESQYATRIQGLIKKNERLRALHSEASQEQYSNKTFEDLPTDAPPPFTVHVVQKGETLFSIAMRYYGSGDMVNKIMLWNQGWIRHPHELYAGLGLVLFNEASTAAGQKVVEQYIESLYDNKEITQK